MDINKSLLVAVCLMMFTGGALAQSLNMTLLAQRDDYPGDYSDIWGYVAPGGAEYALVGSYNGTVFYNVSVPTNPIEVGYIPGPQSLWRDIKVLGNHAYVVNEEDGVGSGLQIISLADPENPVLVTTWDDKFEDAHNLFIDTTRALAYVCGTDKGMHILDLSDPVNPVQTKVLRFLFQFWVHDMLVEDDTLWAADGFLGNFHIMANPNDSTLIEVAQWTYSGAACHSGWWHTDHRYFLTTDEWTNGHLRIWDVSDKQNITEISSYMRGTDASIHNVFVRGDYAFISYYTEGVRVLNVRDPYNPVEIGYYDTYEGEGFFDGAWGVYPYFPSGTIIVSDIQGGLYVFRFDLDTGVGSPTDLVPVASGSLRQNYPNPFNPMTTIDFETGAAGSWQLYIVDVRGRMVRTLFDGSTVNGRQSVMWDGTNDGGRSVASGSYFYRLAGPDTDEVKKMVLIR